MEIQYTAFGLEYVAGKRVTHLSSGSLIRSQCGLQRLGLKVKLDDSMPLCKRCIKTVRIIRALGKKIAVYKSSGVVVAAAERRGAVLEGVSDGEACCG